MKENFWTYSDNETQIELNTIHSPFSIPIFESTILVSNIEEIKKDIYKKYVNYTEKKEGNYYTKYDLHEEDLYAELTKSLLEITQEIFDSYEYINIKPRITGMWANVFGTGEAIHTHSHSNSMFSGVWYPDDAPKSEMASVSNCIRFIDPLRFKYFFMPQIKKQNQYNSGEILIKPKKGMCLIFPSWLEHNTMPNQNETEKRFSISFNIFPEGNLGYPNFLNHLKV